VYLIVDTPLPWLPPSVGGGLPAKAVADTLSATRATTTAARRGHRNDVFISISSFVIALRAT